MINTKGYAVKGPEAKFEIFNFDRRDLRPQDILIEIMFSGICHSDIHQARGEWGNSTFPMVPGHEIVGRVAKIGSGVTKFKENDFAGVGCFVDSCGECDACRQDSEQFCTVHCAYTYNGTETDKTTPTYGGYSTAIVVDQDYALKITSDENLAGVAPLLCAGITTYSPLRRFKVGPGQKVGVVGLGGLGHMAVKLAASMGAEVTVFSTSPSKEEDAKALGAANFVVTKDPANFTPLANSYDFIIDTVSASHDLNSYLGLLKLNGSMVIVGIPENPAAIAAFSLIQNNRILAGSSIGGIAETQEMLDYCAEHKIFSDVEVIDMDGVEEAYERTIKSDVRYRFVIDLKSFRDQ